MVYVCAFLTNFQPALVPLPHDCDENEVERYLNQLSDQDTDDYDVDSEIDSD